MPQRLGQRRRNGEAEVGATLALLRRARTVGGQFENARGIAELVAPELQLPLALAAGQPFVLPEGVVGELDRQFRRRLITGMECTGVEAAQLADEDFHRPAVADDMVQRHQQQMALLLQPQQAGAQQRAAGQVERRAGFLAAQDFRQRLRIGLAAQVGQRQAEALRRLDHLHRFAILQREAGAQRLVTLQQAGEGVFQRQLVEAAIQLQGHRHVVGDALRLQLPEEPQALLRRRQRQPCRPFAALRPGLFDRSGAADGGGQAGHARRIEQRAQRQLHGERLAHPCDDAHGQQRMPADLEEVVVAPYPFGAQHLGPDRRQAGFHLADRRAVFAALPVRRRQRLALQLAVGAERHAFQVDQSRRHHVVRQLAAQGFAQRIAPAARVGHRLVRGDIADQLRAGRRRQRHHHRFAHLRLLEKTRLDLAQLDAQAAQFHLMVDAPGVVDHPVGTPARQVAGAVHALARRAERIGDETLGGQPGAAEVAARQVDPGDVQLAGHAHRHRLQFAVEDQQPGVGDRPADGHRMPARLVDAGPVADVDGRLGGAIEVVQRSGMLLEELLLQLMGQRLAAAQHAAQAGAGRQLAGGDERLQHRRYEMQGGDALLDDGLAQARRIAVRAGLGHDQRGAGHQRPEELPHRDVEAERGLLQHAVAAIQQIGILHPLQAVEQAGVAVADALGPAGGAGGVDAVGEALRRVVDGRRAVRLGVGVAPVAVQAPDLGAALRQAIEQRLLGQQQRHLAVFQHEGEALGRVVRVQRQVGAAGLEDRQQGDGQLRRTLGEHADAHVAADALPAQPVRQAVGPRLQLGIAEAPFAMGQRQGVRGARGLAADQLR
ncbi:hypothetical protein D9M70_327080 [compost metagenome]